MPIPLLPKHVAEVAAVFIISFRTRKAKRPSAKKSQPAPGGRRFADGIIHFGRIFSYKNCCPFCVTTPFLTTSDLFLMKRKFSSANS